MWPCMDAQLPHLHSGSSQTELVRGRRPRLAWRRLAFGAFLCATPWSARAADPLPYTVTLATTGIGPLDAALKGSLRLIALRARAPAGPFAVISRARQDVARLTEALESFGYYRSHATITVAGLALDDPALPDRLESRPADPPAPIAIAIETGPLFHLRHVALEGAVPRSAATAFTLRPGDPADAGHVLAACAAVQNALREDGYALSRVAAPDAVLVPAEQALDVTVRVTAGPRVNLGPITITGLHRVHETYVRRRLLIRPGELFRPSAIDAARQDLAAVGVFSGVVIRTSSSLDAAGTLPVMVDVAERVRHAVSFNVAYSTDLGGSAGATWTLRNVFGNAEQLNLSASITGLGGTDVTAVGYNASAQLLKPDFLRRDQTLQFDLSALKQSLDAYDQTAVIAGVTLTRKLSKLWTASVGLTAEQEQITQEGVVRDYTLVVVPLSAKFDSTGLTNPLDDALHGMRAALSAAPTQSFGSRSATFLVLQGSASTYFDFSSIGWTAPGRSVLAVRGLVGSAQGATSFDLPPDQRFYGGGSATVRGLKYQSVGPLFADDEPEGGAAIDAVGVEFRQRVWGQLGAALFADAAQVSSGNTPFEGTLREGVGAGLRYYTPIGPIRVDVAVPVNKPPNGDSFELYLGIGQAF
jgi:translocation and assembly module TamA